MLGGNQAQHVGGLLQDVWQPGMQTIAYQNENAHIEAMCTSSVRISLHQMAVRCDMLDLFSSIKNQRVMDANGVSVYALRFLCVASPAQFASCLEMLLTRTDLCREQCTWGRQLVAANMYGRGDAG